MKTTSIIITSDDEALVEQVNKEIGGNTLIGAIRYALRHYHPSTAFCKGRQGQWQTCPYYTPPSLLQNDNKE